MIYNVIPATPTGEDDELLVPVTDGSSFTISMLERNKNLQTGDFALCFYDADGVTPITPTAGTVQVDMSPMENVWMAPGVGDATIDATAVIVDGDGLATYTTPVFLGAAYQGRVTLTGISGATFMKAQFRRFQ